MKVLPVYRCVTVSVNVTVMLASVLLIVHSLDPEAVTIATQPQISRCVSITITGYYMYLLFRRATTHDLTANNIHTSQRTESAATFG